MPDYAETIYQLLPERIRDADENSKGMRMICSALGVVSDQSKAIVDDLDNSVFPLDASEKGLVKILKSNGVENLEVVPQVFLRHLAIHLPTLRRLKGTKRCLDDLLTLLGHRAEVVPLFSAFAYPRFHDASHMDNAPFFADAPSSPNVSDPRISVDGVISEEVVGQRRKSFETSFSVSGVVGTSVTLQVQSSEGVAAGHFAYFFDAAAYTGVPIEVISVSPSTVTVRAVPLEVPTSGRVRFFNGSDLLWPSSYYDIRAHLPQNWDGWVTAYADLIPTGLDLSTNAGKLAAVEKILLTQADFLGQFSPCRSEIRWAMVTNL